MEKRQSMDNSIEKYPIVIEIPVAWGEMGPSELNCERHIVVSNGNRYIFRIKCVWLL